MNTTGGIHLFCLSKNRPCIFLNQVRTSLSNRYRHGPRRISNPELDLNDYIRWTKEAFSWAGLEFWKDVIKRVWRYQIVEVNQKNYEIGKTYVFEHFNNEEALKKWTVSVDRDSLNGFSRAELVRSSDGHALFKGVLDTRKPDDGLTENSGFACIMGPNAPKTRFWHYLETKWDWDDFNTLEIRFRGDGRRYNVVVNTASFTSDIEYYDNYTYPLYTRGGPYWQTIRIPFAKFIWTVKHISQDQQTGLAAHRIKFVALHLHDAIDGPFSLEIDYLGLRKDWETVMNDIPYETYQFPHIKFRQISFGSDPPE